MDKELFGVSDASGLYRSSLTRGNSREYKSIIIINNKGKYEKITTNFSSNGIGGWY